MNFFKRLAERAEEIDITMRIMKKGNELTVQYLPGSRKSSCQPIIITGTPDQLDNEFFDGIIPLIDEVSKIQSNLEDVKKKIEEEDKEVRNKKNKPKHEANIKKNAKKIVTDDIENQDNGVEQSNLFDE